MYCPISTVPLLSRDVAWNDLLMAAWITEVTTPRGLYLGLDEPGACAHG